MTPEDNKKLVILLVLVSVLGAVVYLVYLGPFIAGRSRAKQQELTATEEAAAERLEGGEEGVGEVVQMPAPAQVEELVTSALALLKAELPPVPADLRNPFTVSAEAAGPLAMPERQGKPQPDLRFLLSAILWDDEEPVASINGRMAREGDPVGTGITVSRIEPTGVTLSFYYWGRQNNVRLSLSPR